MTSTFRFATRTTAIPHNGQESVATRPQIASAQRFFVALISRGIACALSSADDSSGRRNTFPTIFLTVVCQQVVTHSLFLTFSTTAMESDDSLSQSFGKFSALLEACRVQNTLSSIAALQARAAVLGANVQHASSDDESISSRLLETTTTSRLLRVHPH
jgi:hypothetical protein